MRRTTVYIKVKPLAEGQSRSVDLLFPYPYLIFTKRSFIHELPILFRVPFNSAGPSSFWLPAMEFSLIFSLPRGTCAFNYRGSFFAYAGFFIPMEAVAGRP